MASVFNGPQRPSRVSVETNPLGARIGGAISAFGQGIGRMASAYDKYLERKDLTDASEKMMSDFGDMFSDNSGLQDYSSDLDKFSEAQKKAQSSMDITETDYAKKPKPVTDPVRDNLLSASMDEALAPQWHPPMSGQTDPDWYPSAYAQPAPQAPQIDFGQNQSVAPAYEQKKVEPIRVMVDEMGEKKLPPDVQTKVFKWIFRLSALEAKYGNPKSAIDGLQSINALLDKRYNARLTSMDKLIAEAQKAADRREMMGFNREKFDEQKRHNLVSEGQGNQRIDQGWGRLRLSDRNLGTRERNALNAEINTFVKRAQKRYEETLTSAGSAESLLNKGDLSNAVGPVRILFASAFNRGRPSDKDAAAMMQNPSIAAAVERYSAEKMGTFNTEADREQFKLLGKALSDWARTRLKRDASDWADSTSRLYGADADELEQHALKKFGFDTYSSLGVDTTEGSGSGVKKPEEL